VEVGVNAGSMNGYVRCRCGSTHVWGSHRVSIRTRRAAHVTYTCHACGFSDSVGTADLTVPDWPDAKLRAFGYRLR